VRIVFASLYVEHGLQLTFGLFGGHRLPLNTFAGAGGIIELVGGGLLVIGLYTRIVAFFLSGQMAIAYFRVHFPHGPNPLLNEGERAILYCFVFFYLVFAGGGVVSMDRLMGRS
jgi:putative oxidoreductase